jgi:protein-S-isoprenylcysteine O-methyltransferase Ste14
MVRLGQFLFRYRNFLFPLALPLVLVPGPPVLGTASAAAALGLAVALAGQAIRMATIGLEYIIRGGREKRVYAEKLVTEGIYAHSRNPMYVGNVLIVAGVAVTSNSWGCVALVVPVFMFAYLAITRAEEAYLAASFGEAYRRYCRDVPRFLPRLNGLVATFRGTRFNWRRVLVKEYGTMVGWPTRWLLVCAYSIWRERTGGELVVLLPHFATVAAVLAGFYLAMRALKKRRILVADPPGAVAGASAKSREATRHRAACRTRSRRSRPS